MTSRARLRAAALAGMSALALPGAAHAVPYEIVVGRIEDDPNAPSDEQLTLSGEGRLRIDGGVIADLSLSLRTLADVDGEDAVLTFELTEQDVAVAGGLEGPLAPDLSGVVIGFDGVEAQDGLASFLGGTTNLDFAAGRAAFFCVGDQERLAQCIRGGGGSSGLEGQLEAAVIPVPAGLPLLLSGLGGLVAWRRLRRG